MGVQWRIGFANRDITPQGPLDLAGFAAREQPSIGVHDDLTVKAVAFGDGSSTVALAAVDLVGVDATLVEEIRSSVRNVHRVELDYLAVTATHTHGAPAILQRALLGKVDEDYRRRVVADVALTVANSFENMVPANLAFGLGHEESVGRNRRDPTGPTDPEMPLLVAYSVADGKVLGTLCSYACHPVTLGPNNRLVTRDYPGYVVDLISHFTGGATAIFATGCCGQINTGHSAMDSILGRGFERRTFLEASRIGLTLGGIALNTLGRVSPPGGITETVIPGPLRATQRQIRLPIDSMPRPTESEIATLEALATSISAEKGRRGEAAMAMAHAAWARGYVEVNYIETEIGAISLGDVVMVLLPGEIFVEIGLELKLRFPGLRLITLSYANDAIGYLPHRSAFKEGGYEIDSAYRSYGYAGPFSESAGDVLVGAVCELIENVTNSMSAS